LLPPFEHSSPVPSAVVYPDLAEVRGQEQAKRALEIAAAGAHSLLMTTKDIISRAMLKRLTTDLARHLLGLDGEAIELLETQNQRVEDRWVDLVARMRGADGEEFLLHVEVANNNTTDMPLRMLRYYTDVCLAGHQGPICQFLIYIGSDRLTMPAGLDEPGLLDYRYGLIGYASGRLYRLTGAGQSRRPGTGCAVRFRGP